MRVGLVISQLVAGGAERVMARVANHWAAAGHDVILITIATLADQDHYPLSPEITRVGLGCAEVSTSAIETVTNNLHRVWALRRALKDARPDAAVSFMAETNLLALLAARGLDVPVAVCERIDPRHHSIGRARDALRSLLYPHAAVVVVQTEAVRPWAARFGPTVRVLQNPVDMPPATAVLESPDSSGRELVAMGRLERQKGFDLLVGAFVQLAPAHPHWSLTILGEGPERGNLETQIRAAGLAGRVRLPGKVVPPWDALRDADLFVLSSRYEGFPNALLEAMACGLAVVATDCPSGPRDIVRPDVDGLLVPPGSVDALASALDELMADDQKRVRLAAAARDVTVRFAPATVLAAWDTLLDDLRAWALSRPQRVASW